MEPIDFFKNTNPFGPSKKVLSEFIKSRKKLNKYPDPENIEINNSIASFFKVPLDNVTIVNGSTEAIYSIPEVLKPKKAGLIIPTFWGYEKAIKFNHIKIIKFKLSNSLEYDYEQIDKLARITDLLFLCNPNNPTLSYIEKDKLCKIIKKNRHCHFVIDETVLIFNKDYKKMTLTNMVCQFENLSVICSFSKIFSLSGLRVGALISNTDLISKIKKWKIIFSTNTISQSIIPICVKDKKFLKDSREEIENLVNVFSKKLSSIKWLYVKKGLGNFMSCEIKNDKISADALTKHLKEKGYAIRSLKSYSHLKGEWIRISVNKTGNNNKLLKAIEKYGKKYER